jgi:hypothetical protein
MIFPTFKLHSPQSVNTKLIAQKLATGDRQHVRAHRPEQKQKIRLRSISGKKSWTANKLDE